MAKWALPVSVGPKKGHVVPGVDEVQGTEVGDDVRPQRALVAELELLKTLQAGKRVAQTSPAGGLASGPLDVQRAMNLAGVGSGATR